MRGKNWPEILIGGGTKNRRDYKQAGTEFERAIKSLEPVVQQQEYEVTTARVRVVQEQCQKELLKERKCPGLSFDL